MQEGIPPKHEYLHKPQDRRLYNESFVFEFQSESIQAHTRLGFLPFERRANVWMYIVLTDDVYWYRNERIPIEQVFGLSLQTEAYEQTYQLIEPSQSWDITASGTCNHAIDPEDVFEQTGSPVELDVDVTFVEPLIEPISFNLLVDEQSHYSHAGRYEGSVRINGEEIPIDATGFRDHSWGWYRDWTPGHWGHSWLSVQFEPDDCFALQGQTRPEDGSIRDTFGYHANGDSFRPIKDLNVEYDDGGLERMERGETWARGDYPETATFNVEFENGSEEIICEPQHNLPMGYEDRNWPLTSVDTPWLKSVLNRMPVRCTWNSKDAYGWTDAIHPL